MQITRKHVGIALFLTQCVAAILILLGQMSTDPRSGTTIAIAVAVLSTIALLVAYWRDWQHAGTLNVVLMTLLVGMGTPEPFVTRATAPISLTPIAIALILARPGWIIFASVGVMLIYSVRGAAANGYTSFLNAYLGDMRSVGTLIFMTGSMFLSRLVADTAQRSAERETHRADQARSEAEEKAALLSQQTTELAAKNDQQARLLSVIDVLEVPVIALEEHVLLAPLVGTFDERRLHALTKRLLDHAAAQRTALVIIDISGIPEIEQQNAEGLIRTVQALRLLGCEVMLTGLTASIAQSLAARGSHLNGIPTLPAPQDALARWRMRQ